MIERPILFSTPMVQANLEDRKTMTRRLNGLERMNECPDLWKPYVGDFMIDKKGRFNQKFFSVNGSFSDHAVCPYGNVGDVLWVRETFAPCTDGIAAFKANYPSEILENKLNKGIWKPSIHMPKVDARIWLQVKEIRVERLQSISKEDAIAEGIERQSENLFKSYAAENMFTNNAVDSFLTLWSKINGVESTQANPWVWVIRYKVLSTTGKPESIQSN